ncbi:MAG: DUF3048 domain-containing protein [Acidimicrobiales bacterium]
MTSDGTGDGGDKATRSALQRARRQRGRHRLIGTATAVVGVAVFLTAGTVAYLHFGSSSRTTASASPSSTTAAPPASTTPSPTSSTTTPAAPSCPLTGAPAPGGKVPNRPALAVKIDNYPSARPQSGISHADIVFEEPVEGMVTRYVAVFQCQEAPRVGPVRSARFVDIGILAQIGRPVFAYAGAIKPILSLIAQANVINENVLGATSSIFSRDPNRVAPYNGYLTTAAAWGVHPHQVAPPAPLFTYSATPPPGIPAASVHIPFSTYSNETWTYDPSTHRYLLSYSGVPAMLSDGKQISATNIVAQIVQIHYGPWVENSFGAKEVEATLVGSGPLLVFRNGTEVKGTWQRSGLTARTHLVAANGARIPLAPGRTWVDLVPTFVTPTVTP